MRKFFYWGVLGLLVIGFGFSAFYLYIQYSIPNFVVERVNVLPPKQNTKNLPYFMVMLPLPILENFTFIPQLEYIHGPPKRYLHRLSLHWINASSEPQLRIEIYGRRTQNGASLDLANQLASAIEYRKTGVLPPGISSWNLFGKLRLLQLLHSYIPSKTEKIYIMDQAGVPAFLTLSQSPQEKTAKILFFRRNTLQEIHLYSAKKLTEFSALAFFQKSFLVENRVDALTFIAKELSLVNMKGDTNPTIASMEWPLLLLSAQISNEPASIQAYFHFAGINALLFRKFENSTLNLEVRDILRNNTLVADRFGRDIAPESEWSSEMGRIARALKEL